jgi:hypothetical protein
VKQYLRIPWQELFVSLKCREKEDKEDKEEEKEEEEEEKESLVMYVYNPSTQLLELDDPKFEFGLSCIVRRYQKKKSLKKHYPNEYKYNQI